MVRSPPGVGGDNRNRNIGSSGGGNCGGGRSSGGGSSGGGSCGSAVSILFCLLAVVGQAPNVAGVVVATALVRQQTGESLPPTERH